MCFANSNDSCGFISDIHSFCYLIFSHNYCFANLKYNYCSSFLWQKNFEEQFWCKKENETESSVRHSYHVLMFHSFWVFSSSLQSFNHNVTLYLHLIVLYFTLSLLCYLYISLLFKFWFFCFMHIICRTLLLPKSVFVALWPNYVHLIVTNARSLSLCNCVLRPTICILKSLLFQLFLFALRFSTLWIRFTKTIELKNSQFILFV